MHPKLSASPQLRARSSKKGSGIDVLSDSAFPCYVLVLRPGICFAEPPWVVPRR
jgi:hypothetical protein